MNRTAKLKECKLDVRHEQWLSQVKNKNKGFKEENKGFDDRKMSDSGMHGSSKGEKRSVGKLVSNSCGEEYDGLMNHYCDWESHSNSPVGHTSSLTSDIFGTNYFTSSGDSGGCYSGSMTEEDDGDDACLDDWEAIADALAADEVKSDHDRNLELEMHDHSPQLQAVETIKDDQLNCCASVNHQAWRTDDCFRPQGLPDLLKQNTFPMNSERNYGGSAWGFKNVGTFTPTACPICCEDLDLTDTSFLPCPCGYRLCLFCYKRILEDNGRCRGCRKQCEQFDQGNTTFKLARSYSMIPGH